MQSDERRLIRIALMVLLGISVLSAPRTFSAAPASVPDAIVVGYTASIALCFVALWRNIGSVQTVATIVLTVALASSLYVWANAVDGMLAGTVPAVAVGNVAMETFVSLAGLAFLSLRLRRAAAATAVVIASVVATTALVAGTGTGEVLGTPAVTQSLRYGVYASVLFFVVALIADRRGAERDRTRAEHDAVRTRAAALEDATQARERMYDEAAHELKSPLTIVRGSVETLQAQDDRLDARARQQVLESLLRSVARLQQRVDDILERNHPDGSAGATGPTVLNLSGVLRTIAGDLTPMLADQELVVEAAEDLTVQVPLGALEHVLENLVSNAAKYSPPRTVIRLRAVPDGSHARISVTDQGGGLSADDAERIFEPYVRLGAEAPDSSGMGLAVVRRFVDAWGGRVWCEPHVDHTTFHVTVPLEARGSGAHVQESSNATA